MTRRNLRRILAALCVGALGAAFGVAGPSQADTADTNIVRAVWGEPDPDGPVWFCISVDGQVVGVNQYYYCQGNPLPERLPIPNGPLVPVTP